MVVAVDVIILVVAMFDSGSIFGGFKLEVVKFTGFLEQQAQFSYAQ